MGPRGGPGRGARVCGVVPVMGWLLLVAYLLGWAWTGRRIAVANLEDSARHTLKRRRIHTRPGEDDEPLVDGEERVMAVTIGALVGLAWPVALIVMALSRRLKAPSEVAHAERRELEALRKLAREHGLPMPGDAR